MDESDMSSSSSSEPTDREEVPPHNDHHHHSSEDEYEGHEEEADEDDEPRVQMDESKSMLLKDYIVQERSRLAPHYRPLAVAVSRLSYTVKALPPSQRHNDVYHACLCFSAEKKKAKKDILHDVSFYLKPGQMTILLGAPGCGKSTLIKLLANRLRSGKVTGDLTFNGKDPRKGNFNQDIAYVPQDDVHIAQLTVQETLQFSVDCQMPKHVSKADRQERVRTTMQLLGLTHRAKTVVGDALLRGVSGGEKKRVTIGVETAKNPTVYLLDEPTTGLDSSAAYDVLRALRSGVNMGTTALVALLQPSYDVFNLFDNVMILSHGEIAFLGSKKDAFAHFESLGYRCHPNVNPAEFLQEVVESGTGQCPLPEKYRDLGDEEQGEMEWLKPDEFVARYKESTYFSEVEKTIEQIRSEAQASQPAAKAERMDIGDLTKVDYSENIKYPTSVWWQFWRLTQRSFIKLWRDMPTNRSRIVGCLFISFLLGTLFLRLGDGQTDARTRLGLMFVVMGYFSFSSTNALPSVLVERDVFYRQRDAKYYKPLPYLIANILADVPMTVIEGVLFSCIVYWLCGLNDSEDGGRFGYFLLMCILFYFMFRAFSRAVASWSRDLVAAQSTGPSLLALYLLISGFMITRTNIPGWWIWFFYINPVSYAFMGYASNELFDARYTCGDDELAPPRSVSNFNATYPDGYEGNQVCPLTSGTAFAVNDFDLFDVEELRWIMLACVVAWWLIFTALAYLALRFVRYTPLPAAPMAEMEADDNELSEIDLSKYKKQHKGKGKFDDQAVELDEGNNAGGEVGEKDLSPAGAYLSWNNLDYSVQIRKGLKKVDLQLLHGVHGYVKPGMMLALMGSSGAGKSTLMDVLARRKTGGKIGGEMLINGRKADSNLNRVIGYVEQQDIHNPTQTVLEALQYSAICRLPHSIPKEEKKKFAKSLLKLLGLEGQANAIIGNNSQDGLSADQRKRVTIGVEMAADPAILFLDEPTSGLDSFGAERVMKAVKNISARGTSIVCTIHQPSSTIFSMFTHLLLLKKGGYMTYFGPIGEEDGDCSVLLDYFAKLGSHLKPNQNPAEFILEVTGAGIPKAAKQIQRSDDSAEEEPAKPPAGDNDAYVAAYQNSEFCKKALQQLDEGIYPIQRERETKGRLGRRWKKIKERMQGRYANPMHVQFTETVKRAFIAVWRTPNEFWNKIIGPLVLGVIMGTLFLQMDNTQAGATQRSAVIFFSMLICDLLAMPAIPKILNERAVFYREHAARTYNSLVYASSIIIPELPFAVITAVVYTIPVYFISGLQYDADRYFIFFGIFLLSNLLAISLCHIIGLLSPNVVIANSLSAILFTLFSLLAGFLITRDDIGGWWIWMHYIDVNMFSLEVLMINEFKGLALHCEGHEFAQVPIASQPGVFKEYCGITTGEQYLDSISFSEDNMVRDAMLLLGFYFIFLFITAFLVKFLKWQKR
jgi:ABC-type multidrug transport system ATPase subunit